MRGVVLLVLCACTSNAAAQISGTLTGLSDYRYRGISLTDGRPAAQVSVGYDDPSGWYGGVFGSTVRMRPPGGTSSYFQTIAYGGYAAHVTPGLSVEVGGDYAAFANASDINYGELFIGAAIENVSARIYYSPRYFGESSGAVYGEVNATQPLFDGVRLFAHAGFLRYRYASPYGLIPPFGETTERVIDGRLGVRVDLDPFQLEVAWVGVNNHIAGYLVTGTSTPNGVVVSLSLAF